MPERWRGTVAVTPYDRRALVVSDDALLVEGPAGRVEFDLRSLAQDGVLLVGDTTMTLVAEGQERLQLRAVDPPRFDAVDWPPDVAERVEAQRAASAAARAQLRRQLTRLVAGTIAGLGLLLVVLVIVLLVA